ncbi:ribosome maturation factor RimM [Bartonella sp. B10]
MEHNRKNLKNKVYLAIIGSAHGIKGDVFVKILSDEPWRLKSYGTLYDDIGHTYEITSLRVQKGNAIVHFKGIEDRSIAETLKGVHLYIMRDQLANNLAEDEFYQIDLIGLRVQDCVGKVLGEVSGFFNFGAGDLLEVCLDTRKTVLIPFNKVAVPEIYVASGFIVVDPLAAGLSEEERNSKSGKKRRMILNVKNKNEGMQE